MVKVAIIEDEESAYSILKSYLTQFGEENGRAFTVEHFTDGLSFLEKCTGFDLVFMDIELPLGVNGMDVAVKMREKDPNVPLIFVTNMVQYAIRGYAVDAIDYVLKPIQYNRFYSLMMKVSKIITINQQSEIVVKTLGGKNKILLSKLVYVRISDHLLIYKTTEEEVETWGSLSNAEALLPKETFIRCNNSTIINLNMVSSFDKENVYLTKDKIAVPVSRSRRKMVLQMLNEHMG